MGILVFNDIVVFINNIFWGDGQVFIYMLVVVGIWFIVCLGGVQFCYFGYMFMLFKGSIFSIKEGISLFQVLCISLFVCVGIGNFVGVVVVILLGGVGSIFWMWVIVFLGMVIGFVESVFGQFYKVKDDNGEYWGGFVYYIK